MKAVLHIDGMEPHELSRPVVIGREPVGGDGIDVITLTGDPIVSRSHLAFDVIRDGVVVIDLGSTNGTKITVGGVTRNVPTDVWTIVDASAVVNVGDTPIWVEYGASDHLEKIAAPVLAPLKAGCISCGQRLVAGSRFCDGCGALIAPESAPPPSNVAAAAMPTGRVVTSPPASPSRPSAGRTLGRKSGTTADRRASEVTLLLKQRRMGAVATVVTVVVIVWVIFARGNNASDLSASTFPRVSLGIEERWSVDIDGATSVVGSASDVFVFAIEDGDAAVISLDGSSGEERWSSDVGRNMSSGYVRGVLDDVVLIQACDFEGCELIGIDASTGEELWSDPFPDGSVFISSRATLVVSESGSLTLLNPLDGQRIERVRGDSLSVFGDHVYVRDNDEIEVFDLKDLSSVFGPVEVDEDIVGSILQSGKLITAVDDELVIINSDGTVDRESRVPADEIYRILPGPNGMVIVGTDDGVFGLDPIDGRAEEIWSANGGISFGFVSNDGPLVVVADGEDAEVLDSRTGDTRFDLRGYFESNQLIGSNGLVNVASVVTRYEVSAFRYSDGEEIWEDDFDGSIFLIDNGLVEIDDGEVRFFR